jgi:predicted Zn-dependent protease
MHRVRLLAVAGAIGLSACATVPDTDYDRQLGKQAAEQVKTEIGIVDDAPLNSYVERVGRRLAASLPQRQFEHRFAVVDQDSPNAFAVPGGYVYVSRGLLALMQSEAELAGVLGHEMEHVERRHSVQQMRADARLGVFALPGLLLGSVIGEDAATLAAAPFAAVSAGYSRDHEREADVLGQQLAAAAGYDPMGIARVIGRLEHFLEVTTRRKHAPTWFDDHPSTPERVASLTQRASGLTVPQRPPIASDADFVKRLDGLLVGPNPAEGVVRGEVFLHPELGLRIGFPEGWAVTNARQAVMAAAPGEDGVVMLRALGKGGAADLPEIADAYAAKLAARSGTTPRQASGTTPAGLPSRTVSLGDGARQGATHLEVTWVAFQGLVYQIIGAGPAKYQPLLAEVVRSLRPINAGERASITALRLRVVSARKGETVAAVANRVGAGVDAAVVAAMNGVERSASFAGGESVKVPVRVPYR